MNVNEILNDEVTTLTAELGHIRSQLKDAARRNDETALVALSNRRAELPTLIQKAKMQNFAKRLSVQRSRVAAFEIELQNAVAQAGTLSNQIEPKIAELNAEIERLRSEWAFAIAEKESLQFAAKVERENLDRILSERVDLLVAQFD
jgi:regulator of replication initiation timing